MLRFLVNGHLDLTFNTVGYNSINYGGTESLAQAVAIQDDGKIVVAGSDGNNTAVARFNTDGTLDTTFKGPSGAGSGWSTKDFGSGTFDSAVSVALQTNGKIDLGGIANGHMLVAQLKPTAPSTPPSTPPATACQLRTGSDIGYSIAVDASGKVVIAGTHNATRHSTFAVARLTTAGALDTTFNTTGMVTTSLTGGDTGLARGDRQLRPDRRAGDAGSSIGVARYTTAGALDTTFNTTGKETLTVSGATTGESIALDPLAGS